MSSPQLISEKPLNMADLKEELDKIKQRDKELSYRANKTIDYLNQFSMLSKKDAGALFDKLMKLDIPRLKEQYIHKIIDIMPGDIEQLKLILQDTITLNSEIMKKIINVVNEYKQKK